MCMSLSFMIINRWQSVSWLMKQAPSQRSLSRKNQPLSSQRVPGCPLSWVTVFRYNALHDFLLSVLSFTPFHFVPGSYPVPRKRHCVP